MPKKGTIYTEGLNRPGKKTGRCYGHVVAALRALAGDIRTDSLEPKFNRRRLGIALTYLTNIGEFERVRKGRGGPDGGVPAVYRRVNKGKSVPIRQVERAQSISLNRE